MMTMSTLPEMVEISEDELKLPNSGILVLSGPSNCGKTHALTEIILKSSEVFVEPPCRWIVVYRYWQKQYDRLEKELGSAKITFIQNWRKNLLDELGLTGRKEGEPSIGLILDDIAEQLAADPQSLPLFSGGVHHHSLFLIYVTQFLFLQNDVQRQALRQTQFMLIFDNVKHRSGLKTLSQQIFQSTTFLPEAMAEQHRSMGPYHPLLLDLRPYLSKDVLRCRSGPFFPDKGLFIYVPLLTRRR